MLSVVTPEEASDRMLVAWLRPQVSCRDEGGRYDMTGREKSCQDSLLNGLQKLLLGAGDVNGCPLKMLSRNQDRVAELGARHHRAESWLELLWLDHASA